MSGYGYVDDGAEHAIILSENEVFRVRQELQYQQSLPKLKFCRGCGNKMPKARVDAMGGCIYCVLCQQAQETVIRRTKMVQRML